MRIYMVQYFLSHDVVGGGSWLGAHDLRMVVNINARRKEGRNPAWPNHENCTYDTYRLYTRIARGSK